MKAHDFFHLCHELVQVRWFPRIRLRGTIYLVRFADRQEYGLELLPVVAVAEDIFGRKAEVHDIGTAASALELPNYLTVLIHKASCGRGLDDPAVREVREELVSSIKDENCLLRRVG